MRNEGAVLRKSYLSQTRPAAYCRFTSNVRLHQIHTANIRSATVNSSKNCCQPFYAECTSSEIHKQERQEPLNSKAHGGHAMCRRRWIGRLEYRTRIANPLVCVKRRTGRKAFAPVHSVGGAGNFYRFKAQHCCTPSQYVHIQFSSGTNRAVGAA